MDPRPSKHKRSVSDRLSEKLNKVFRRSPSPSASQEHSQTSTVRSPPSPLLANQTELSHSGSASTSAKEEVIGGVELVQTSLPALGVVAPVAVAQRSEPPTIVVSTAATGSSSDNNLENPTIVVSAPETSRGATSGVWVVLETALRALHKNAGLLPPLQSAIGTLVGCLDVLEEAAKNRQEYTELTSDLASLADLLAAHLKRSSSVRMSSSIANVARSIEEQAKLIENKRGRGAGGRLMELNADEEELKRHYRRIGSLFQQLQADANLSIWNIVNDQMANTRLKELAPVQLAYYNSKLSTGISRRTCTPNTRTAILSGLNDWSHNPSAADLYWMNGMAGTGKTTIACSFSKSLEERKQLAASFFCTRTVPECREATRIIPTIAYQLARYSVPFQSVLCEALAEDPDVSAKNITMQFERLLKSSLLKVKEAMPNDLVVVIDALDECSDMREVELLLAILLKSVKELPLKFFVTSRPEPEIYRRMLARGQGAGGMLHLHDVEKSLVQADIETCLAVELEFMSPTPAQIKELSWRSGNLFIYAATLVRYIRPGKRSVNPYTRLQSILAMTSQPTKMHAEIDELYTAVLKSALDAEDLEDEEVEDLRLVLWSTVCVQEPVGVDTIAAMTGINNAQRVVIALEALRSVIYFSETSGLVSTLHASFPDFVFDETRSKEFACNLVSHSELLTRRCFEVMHARLHFNICRLESSFIPDREVGNLEERVKQSISPPLWYACRYWANHLRHSTYSDLLCTMLSDFLSDRLLFWMEALNLKREICMGAEILLQSKLWLKNGVAPADLAKLAEDARNFVTAFSANPVSESTPHIYLSSLPFCPKSSSVFKQYWEKMQGIINVSGSAMLMRETAPLASWKVQSTVHSIVYSPDGSCISVGCEDSTISVRSAHDGALLAGPFQGHTDMVRSVAYSPDGSCIASGSADHTIRVWSAHGGRLLAGPFQGHTDPVRSVAYSPDGSRIVSGSEDKTIRVWSARDGTLLTDPFQGHGDWVLSVAYSPDASRIVSGSADYTIRVWSAHDGAPLAGPFQGHTDWVYSVAYSPDGLRIASGSGDQTILVWSVHDGALLTGPLEGHTDWVRSVAYSLDGSHIVSGSADKTIRVWSALDGTPLAGPFEGHGNLVLSVAFSPDSSRIVSGSNDRTIRVWSAHDSTLPGGPFQGHASLVRSVAYSPDGSCIASGCADSTIQVSSAYDGRPLADPFQGHTDSVWSVAYSPDGSRIASGSEDETIRVWGTRDGAPLAGPFQGHTAPVWSVAYSPDGSRIASGSKDKTIRVWSARDGTLLAGPLRGHTKAVNSVAYSPDSSRIVSGSGDNTIRVWSTYDGALVAGPFQRHTNPVRSVAYSPDGSRIVSSSEDTTIQVWSAHDGTPLADPFQGHTNWVLSVAYSPDGSCIVSGSVDNTIRVWSAHDGVLLAGPFQGHTDSVWSVAYSPDGSCIVSGSSDNTTRVLAVHETLPITDPSHACTDPVSRPSISTTSEDSSLRHSTAFQASNPPTPYHICKPNSPLAHWAVRRDRWVVNKNSQLLFWVPFELARYLPAGNELLLIYPYGLFQIDQDDMILGERWSLCYKLE